MPMFPHVLVVDDGPVDRRLVGGLLEADQFLQVEFAENGEEGLEKVEQQTPQLVLTDLVMPKMDGLQFVREMQVRRPSIPIVLMTAHGSGTTAIEALRAGAASYIPKSQLADRLMATVRRLLGMSREGSNLQRLAEYQKYIHYKFEIANKASLVDAIVALVQRAASSIRLGRSGERLQIGVALEQALLNAIYHGNLELDVHQLHEERTEGTIHNFVRSRAAEPPYRDRVVHVGIQIWQDEARFTVRDEGSGFDTTIVPRANDPDELDRPEGHGLVLMTNLMDEVIFNDRGNEVTLIKRRVIGE